MTTKAKKLTAEAFQKAVSQLSINETNQAIAKAVLVDGLAQSAMAAKHGITKGAVSQTVNRVWQIAQLQRGKLVQVTALLPEAQAQTVKKWEQEALLSKK